MLLWIILGLGWIAVLLAAVALVRLAGYADKKVRRRLTERPRRSEDQAA
jgi:hypothetical protein